MSITSVAQLKRQIKVGTRMHAVHHGFRLKDGTRTPEKDMGDLVVSRVQGNAIAFAPNKPDDRREMWSWWGKAADIRFIENGYIKLDDGEPLVTYTFLEGESAA